MWQAFDFDESGVLDIDEFTVLMGKFCGGKVGRDDVVKSFEMCGGEGCTELSKVRAMRCIGCGVPESPDGIGGVARCDDGP